MLRLEEEHLRSQGKVSKSPCVTSTGRTSLFLHTHYLGKAAGPWRVPEVSNRV